MSYVNPEEVKSTKRWKLSSVIYDAGEGNIALAIGEWDKYAAFGIRWNGTVGKPAGNPLSSGKPTWFILPTDFGFPIVQDLLIKQALGNKYIKKAGLEVALNWMKEMHSLNIEPDRMLY